MKSEIVPDASQPEKKTKKKTKKKIQVEGDLNMALPDLTNSQENRRMSFENQSTNAKAMPQRTLSNGLIIEEVANGQPDGKVASHGKKVKLCRPVGDTSFYHLVVYIDQATYLLAYINLGSGQNFLLCHVEGEWSYI